MAHDLCDDLELVADCGYDDDDYLDDFHFHDDDGFPSSPATTTAAASGSGLQVYTIASLPHLCFVTVRCQVYLFQKLVSFEFKFQPTSVA